MSRQAPNKNVHFYPLQLVLLLTQLNMAAVFADVPLLLKGIYKDSLKIVRLFVLAAKTGKNYLILQTQIKA